MDIKIVSFLYFQNRSVFGTMRLSSPMYSSFGLQLLLPKLKVDLPKKRHFGKAQAAVPEGAKSLPKTYRGLCGDCSETPNPYNVSERYWRYISNLYCSTPPICNAVLTVGLLYGAGAETLIFVTGTSGKKSETFRPLAEKPKSAVDTQKTKKNWCLGIRC